MAGLADLFTATPERTHQAILRERQRQLEAQRLAEMTERAATAREGYSANPDTSLASAFTLAPRGLRENSLTDLPTDWRQEVQQAAGVAAEATGGKPRSQAARDASSIMSVTDWAPGVGDVSDVMDTGQSFARGNYGEGVLGAILSAIPLVPAKKTIAAGKKALKEGPTKAVMEVVDTALHGTPEPASSIRALGLKPEGERIQGPEPDYTPPPIGHNQPPGKALPVERGSKKKAASVASDLAAAVTAPPPTLTYKHPISGIKLDTPLEEMQAELVPFGKMKEKRIIRPEELLGKTAILMRGDPAAAGQTLLGTSGRKYADPVNLYGGEGYPRMEMNTEAGRVWASKQSQAQNLANQAAGIEGDVVGIYQKMGGRSTAYNTMLSEALLQEFKLNRPKISSADVKEFDRLMREEAWSPKKNGGFDRPAYPDWPGLDKLTPEYLRAAPDGKVRNKMFDLMDSRAWRNKGFPDAALANYATTDRELLNTPAGTVGGSVVNLDKSGKVSKESGHPTYESGVLGTEAGVFPSLPLDVYAPGYRETGGTNGGPISNSALEKFLQTKPPVIKLDEPTLERFMKYMRSQEGFKWGIGGAVAAGIISEEQARQLGQAPDREAAQ